VGNGKENAEAQVKEKADRPRRATVVGDRGAEQQRQIHPRQRQFARRLHQRREHQRAEESTGDSRREHQRFSDRAIAASTSARWTSACGKLPRNAPLPGSISSAYSPTSLARPASRSISSVASSTRPDRASALTSQNEQFRKLPSPPGTPSSAWYR